jgi:aquaporin Z
MEYRKYLSETVGTFALVFCGTGAIVINQEMDGAITHAGIAATFGLIVMVMIFALGDVSGAHLNPVVTLAFVIDRQFPLKQMIPYWLSQAMGAFVASGSLKILFPGNEWLGATLPNGPPVQSFFLELILTFILVLVIFNVSKGAKEKGITAAIAIGATVGLEAMFAGPICGASMNPFRSLAPAIVSMHTKHLWIYLTGPLLGGLLGLGIHKAIYKK